MLDPNSLPDVLTRDELAEKLYDIMSSARVLDLALDGLDTNSAEVLRHSARVHIIDPLFDLAMQLRADSEVANG